MGLDQDREMRIPVGISDFEKIRRNGYYYIDKSSLIRELLKTEAVEVTLITRPRRFGKTLGMSMMAEFFDIRKDSASLFDGLEISREKDLCEKWRNRWPTLFVSFRGVDGIHFEEAYAMLEAVIARTCIEHRYLLEDPDISEYHKCVFDRLASKTASLEEVKNSFLLLTEMMRIHYGRPVILLLDEYDVPLAKANEKQYYGKMLSIIKGILQACKDNPALCFAVITGCLRISKESIFTGTNNMVMDSISGNRFHEYFGFTEKEVQRLLCDAQCQEYAGKIKEWYDGYQFGSIDVYCPWDVLNYVNRLLLEGITEPENYWEHTSDNAIIKNFLQNTEFDITDKLETLLRGECITEIISESLTYDALETEEENLWSLLYLTGYLTRAKNNCSCLRIPNAEVMEIFENNIQEWMRNKTSADERKRLFEALWKGETERLTELISDLLFDTISFHDYAESYYHAFLAGLFVGCGYTVESNYENGLGRSDVTIKDRKKRRAIVIEAKIARSEEALEKECQEALGQIEEKQYARRLERLGFREVSRLGIAFYRKSCLVRSALR